MHVTKSSVLLLLQQYVLPESAFDTLCIWDQGTRDKQTDADIRSRPKLKQMQRYVTLLCCLAPDVLC